MNEFLEQIKFYLKSNPSLINDNLENFLYGQLISFNLGNHQQPLKEAGHFFNMWVDRNKFNSNMKTFVSDRWPYFCQFTNGLENVTADNVIKLYIPMDENHLYEGANRLFDFLSANNIKHRSKIGRQIRNDNVVVRVSDFNDAEKIIVFVLNDPYIRDGLMNINPFTINIGGVGIAKDGKYSYNTKFCESLAELIVILAKNDRLDNLNSSSLLTYLDQIKDTKDDDLRAINALQRNVLSGKKLGYEDFKKIVSESTLSFEENKKEQLLREIINITFEKYGMKHTVNAIIRYRHNEDGLGFTRDNGARSNLYKYIKLEDLDRIIKKYNSDTFEDFINDIIIRKEIGYKYIINAYRETFIKYGKDNAKYAMNHYVKTGDANHITNNNIARNNLVKNVPYTDVCNILRREFNLHDDILDDEVIDIFVTQMGSKIPS